jgi:hypothetical protein
VDRFRYYLLYEKGGWWFDMDFVSIRMKSEPGDLMVASTWEHEWGSAPIIAPYIRARGTIEFAGCGANATNLLKVRTSRSEKPVHF